MWADLRRVLFGDLPAELSADERDFCRQLVVSYHESLAYVACYATIAVHLAALLIDPWIGGARMAALLLPAHLGYLAVAAVWFAFRRKMPFGVRPFAVMGIVAYVTYFAALPALLGTFVTAPDAALRTWATTYLLFAGFGVLLCPYDGWVNLAVGALFIAAGLTPIGISAQTGVWVLAVLLGLGATVVYKRLIMQWARDEAVRTYRARLAIAPAPVARLTALSTEALDELFRPSVRPCVCVSSDWRRFAEQTAGAANASVGAALSEYYAMCETLLTETIPGGNYYSDWIADELVVVLFPLPHAAEGELETLALTFARRLLAAKQEFASRHGLPSGIDVGIAAGEALVGMMGPVGFRKATALGEVPARARQLQGMGKLLRRRLGEKDRIVCGQEVSRAVPDAGAMTFFDLVGEAADLADGGFYYREQDAA